MSPIKSYLISISIFFGILISIAFFILLPKYYSYHKNENVRRNQLQLNKVREFVNSIERETVRRSLSDNSFSIDYYGNDLDFEKVKLYGEKYVRYHLENVTMDITTKSCSNTCICSGGGLRKYGMWCGYRYGGCLWNAVCDSLDECCRMHDSCVGTNGYLSCDCAIALTNCATCAYMAAIQNITAPDHHRHSCSNLADAALITIADIKFVQPSCFS